MLLKTIATTIATCIALTMQCCATRETITTHDITIRPATLNDLDAINNITHQLYRTQFKPLFAQLISPEHTIENFMTEKITAQQNATREYIIKQINQEKYGLIVAQETTSHEIIGYCRFYQKNPTNVHIAFLGINELFREKKFGTKLLFAAINTFDNINNCTLRTLAHNNDIAHAFYKKNGFTLTGFISLDLITAAIITDSTARITHAEYCLEIKK